MARKLLLDGVYIIPAIYPAVRLKDSRLRLNVSEVQTKEDLDYFVDDLVKVNAEIPFVK